MSRSCLNNPASLSETILPDPLHQNRLSLKNLPLQENTSQALHNVDCIFLVSEEEKEKAIEVLKKAWDAFWEEGEGWC